MLDGKPPTTGPRDMPVSPRDHAELQTRLRILRQLTDKLRAARVQVSPDEQPSGLGSVARRRSEWHKPYIAGHLGCGTLGLQKQAVTLLVLSDPAQGTAARPVLML